MNNNFKYFIEQVSVKVKVTNLNLIDLIRNLFCPIIGIETYTQEGSE